jgi:predicted DNA-binding transcriptional regulator AlpA
MNNDIDDTLKLAICHISRMISMPEILEVQSNLHCSVTSIYEHVSQHHIPAHVSHHAPILVIP